MGVPAYMNMPHMFAPVMMSFGESFKRCVVAGAHDVMCRPGLTASGADKKWKADLADKSIQKERVKKLSPDGGVFTGEMAA